MIRMCERGRTQPFRLIADPQSPRPIAGEVATHPISVGVKLIFKRFSSDLSEMGRVGATPSAGESRALGCKGDRAVEFIGGHFGERLRRNPAHGA